MAHFLRWDEGWKWGEVFWGQLVPDSTNWKGKRHMADIIPGGREDYRGWLTNLRNEIATRGPGIGLDAPRIAGVQATCDAQLTKMGGTDTARNEADAKEEIEKDGKAMTDATLREELDAWKQMPGWSNDAAVALRATSSRPPFDPATYKPDFKARIVGGEIRLDWIKKGVFGVHIYARLKGQTTWTRIATDTSSPYLDGRELAQPGVPETREYMMRGINRDEDEIGLDSDIVAITWGG